MSARLRFGLWVGALFAGVAAIVATVLVLVVAEARGPDRHAVARVLDDAAPLLAFVALLVLFACGGAVRWLFARLVAPMHALAEQALIVASANPGHRVRCDAGPEASEVASAINRLGDAYRAVGGDMAARVAESNASLEEERNRLAALMSELSEGVIVCNQQGRILLYNEQARALFAPAAGAAAGPGPVGLGRVIFSFLDRDQVSHAVEKIRHGLGREAASPVTMVFPARVGGDLVRVRFAPFLSTGGDIAGLVLTCEDVTRAYGREARRRSLLQALAMRLRQPAANVRAAAENLTSFPDMGEPERRRFAEIIAAESRSLSVAIDEALREYADALTAGVSLEDMRLADLLAMVEGRIGAAPGLRLARVPVDEALWVTADSFAIAQAMGALAARLSTEHGVGEVELRAAARGGFAEVDLAWSGAAIPPGALDLWEADLVRVGFAQAPITIRQALERQGGEVWHQSDAPSGRSWFRFLLPLAQPAAERPLRAGLESRPEYYDFDLFRVSDSARELLGRRLADLDYTVFDTETTGVQPSAGDKIVSIGAVRIVNGRLLKNEVFEQLVDPGRPVPRTATRIHGIKPEHVAGQPTLPQVLPAFHRFCEDTVLVAHNAAFDMRFLELAQDESGVRFAQPVLDTLLLSALVHRNQQDHSLEAIAERLGVAVTGRHTALGDALMTSEIFLKLVQLLAEQGIGTLGEAIEASRETYYVRLQY